MTQVILFLNMGGSEIMLIIGAILLLFGGKKLPELARGLGKGIREFKDASEGVKREIHRNINAMDVEEDVKTTDNSRHHPEKEVIEETSPEINTTTTLDQQEIDIRRPKNTSEYRPFNKGANVESVENIETDTKS